jgi:hypothetical protein
MKNTVFFCEKRILTKKRNVTLLFQRMDENIEPESLNLMPTGQRYSNFYADL